MNNVNKEAFIETAESVQDDPDAAKKHKSVSGSWTFENEQPQYTTTLDYPEGEVDLEAELPGFAGGWGTSPDPIQYCLHGMAACFGGIFAATAATEGLTLTDLSIRVEADLDIRKIVGVSDADSIEEVRFLVTAEGPSYSELDRVLELAMDRCPAIECLAQETAFETNVE